MKKIILLFALAMLFLLTIPVAADSTGPPENYHFYCQQLQEDYPGWFADNFDSHGDCVSHHLLQHIEWCEEIVSTRPEYGYTNLGQCIKVEMQPWK